MKELNLIDMHAHTKYSDGELTPDELILKAKNEGLSTIAITDHDTLLGIQNITIPKEEGIQVINGIELSAKVPIGSMHILGYDINIYDAKLNEKMKELHNRSLYSVSAIICQLKKDYDIVFSTEEILEILNRESNIGRPDIAKLLIQNGYVSTTQEAFERYLLEANRKCGKARKGIPMDECIKLIKDAGGLAVLAHPITLKKSQEELDILVGQLVDFGLDGIEVYHSEHSEKNCEEYLNLADKYNLLISAGSDYHGPIVKPNIELGRGKNNIKVKQLTLLDAINSRRH